MTIASALVGLQHYDGAIEVLDRSMSHAPDEARKPAVDNERRLAGQMRRSFDKPGIKAQLGKYKCVGVQRSRRRLSSASRRPKDSSCARSELIKAAGKIAAICLEAGLAPRGDPRRRRDLLKPDPVSAIELAEAELSQVREGDALA